MDATGDRGIDVVFDNVGQAVMDDDLLPSALSDTVTHCCWVTRSKP